MLKDEAQEIVNMLSAEFGRGRGERRRGSYGLRYSHLR